MCGHKGISDGTVGRSAAPGVLSETEFQILTKLVGGQTPGEIAQQSGCSEQFVAIALSSVRKRTGSKTLVHTIVQLLRAGILKL